MHELLRVTEESKYVSLIHVKSQLCIVLYASNKDTLSVLRAIRLFTSH